MLILSCIIYIIPIYWGLSYYKWSPPPPPDYPQLSSLVTQPPKTHTKKGSGNIVYNELSKTQGGATNQIAPFAIKSL